MTQKNLPVITYSWKQFFTDYWTLLGTRKKQFVFWSLLLNSAWVWEFIPPLLLGLIINTLVQYPQTQSLEEFYKYVLLLAGGHAFFAIIRLTSKDRLGKISIDGVYDLKVEAFERLMNFSIEWHQKENSGNKVQRIQNGLDAYKQFNFVLRQELFDTLITFVGVITVSAFLNVTFLLFYLVYIIVFWGIQWYFNRSLEKKQEQYKVATEHSSGTYFESANNVLTIKTLGAAGTMQQNVKSAEEQARDHDNAMRVIGNNKWKVFQVWNSFSNGIFLLLIGQQVIAGVILAGAIITYYSYFERLRASSGHFGDMIANLLDFKSSISRMMPIFEHTFEEDGKQKFPKEWSYLKLQNISFIYNSNESSLPNLQNISITIKKGEKIGIVGKSGSGKSTLAKILLGLYKPNSGRITLGETDFYDISSHERSKHISTVLQETELFSMSLKENITMMKNISQVQLAQAIKISQLDDVVTKLPKGIDTKIGEKGYKLSGGERQRIGIARAICSGAEILIFDEATSALDSATERRIQKALDTELENRTIITIAHRVSTLQNTDHIFVFSKGTIIESGKYMDLQSDTSSKFFKISSVQSS